MRQWILVVIALIACATGSDEPGGGGANLPHTHITPVYVPDEPIAMELADADLGRPWGIKNNEGDIVIWANSKSAIVRSDMPDFEFVATQGWENGLVAHPSVLARGDQNIWMAYTTGDSEAIGLAQQTSEKLWKPLTEPILVPEQDWEDSHVGHPSLVWDAAMKRVLLFYVGGSGAGIGIATSDSMKGAFQRLTQQPIFTPELVVEENKDSFQTKPLTGASCLIGATALDRKLYECYFSAGGNVGYAAGFEPTQLTAFSLNPILEGDGYNISSPMRVGNILLHVRNKKRLSPVQGRIVGRAIFGQPPESLGTE